MDKLERVQYKYKALTDFKFFCEHVLGYQRNDELGYYDLTKDHYDLMDMLQHSPKKSKMVLMPRHSFKSQVVTVGHILWCILRNPNERILIYSDSAGKAEGFLSGIKNHVEGKAANSKFREIFGAWETQPHKGVWNNSSIVVRTRTQWHKEPTVDTAGIESTKVGMHYERIYFDDIVSDVNTTTKAQMDKVHDCYKKSLSLLQPGGYVTVTGTRWHYGDTYGRIINEDHDGKTFDFYIRDAEQIKDGKLIFESIGLNRAFLDDQKRRQGSYIYSCIYRNNPVDDETALFREENWKYYNLTPEFHKDLFITGTCDPAGEGEDYTAIVVVGWDAKGNMFVLDAINKHLKPRNIIDTIIRLNYKWGFDRFGMERNFFKGMFEKQFREAEKDHIENEEYKQFVLREDIVASVKQKTFNRILALQPFHEKGMIHLPARNFHDLSETFSNLAFQVQQFTIDGAKSPHDDLLVALAMQLDLKGKGGTIIQKEAPYSSAAWFEKQQIDHMENARIPRRYRARYEPAFQD